MSLRPLMVLALAGLLLLPDWSDAWQRRRRVATAVPCSPAFAYSAPVYHPPVVSAPVYHQPTHSSLPVVSPVVSYPAVACCPPVVNSPTVISGPRVEQERSAAVPMKMAEVGNETSKPKPSAGMAEPKPTNTADLTAPKPRPEVVVPQPPVIRTINNEERVPATPVPAAPPANIEPALPRFPDSAMPKAAPAPAEEPMKVPVKSESLPAFPTPGDSKPVLPAFPTPGEPKTTEPKAVEPKSEALPQFDLPPLPPLAPPQSAPSEKKTVVQSSPVGSGNADVYPLAGAAPLSPDSLRRVSFVNKSEREVLLSVAGRISTLRPNHVFTLELPAEFKWQIGDETEQTVTVPKSAPGVDVVIRK